MCPHRRHRCPDPADALNVSDTVSRKALARGVKLDLKVEFRLMWLRRDGRSEECVHGRRVGPGQLIEDGSNDRVGRQ